MALFARILRARHRRHRIAGRGTDMEPDPRSPAEMAVPSHLDWRALARDLADEIARVSIAPTLVSRRHGQGRSLGW